MSETKKNKTKISTGTKSRLKTTKKQKTQICSTNAVPLIYYDCKHIDFFFSRQTVKLRLDHLHSTLWATLGSSAHTYALRPAALPNGPCELTKQKKICSATRAAQTDGWSKTNGNGVLLKPSASITCEARCCITSLLFRLFSLHHFLPFVPPLHSSTAGPGAKLWIDSRARAVSLPLTCARPSLKLLPPGDLCLSGAREAS